jgi:hypothetical protein
MYGWCLFPIMKTEIGMYNILVNDCYVKFEVVKALTVKVPVFWDIMLCSVAFMHQRLGETCCLHCQGSSVSFAWRKCHRYWEKRVDWGWASRQGGELRMQRNKVRLLERCFSSPALTNGHFQVQILICCILVAQLGWPDLCSDLLCSYICLVFAVYALFTYPADIFLTYL